ncbi:hypothetical protein SAMN02787144_1022105 [Streptomyces atratus]|uniref:Uncharacterized protein n=1 Tax=Streptomyces atratus TaxID=1893 RepID=A0A1K2ESK1_STRAR|nr:hypothetical protein SAMN02787144_1022105 [Streptomyces atratus]
MTAFDGWALGGRAGLRQTDGPTVDGSSAGGAFWPVRRVRRPVASVRRADPSVAQSAVSVFIVPPRNSDSEHREGVGAFTGLPTFRQSTVIVTLPPAGTRIGVTKW